ncbi:MAG: PfkB family carbohydrate kinase, partial [Dehalococcoidia bacterium]
MTQRPPAVFGTGLLALDVIVSARPDVSPRLAAGGTCGNVLSILSYMGWRSFPIARLGGDPQSQLVREELGRAGVSLRFLEQTPPAPTPVFVQTIRQDRSGKVSHRFSTNCPACGAWLPSYRPVTAAAARQVLATLEEDGADMRQAVFFFDRASRGALVLAQWFKDKGALIVFEPAGKGEPRLFAEAVAVADILKYSAERVSVETRSACASSPPLLEIETRAAEGLRYRSHITGTAWRHLGSAPAPRVVDTAGAGDWCTAGLLFALGCSSEALSAHQPEALEHALRVGQSLAALACGHEGARGLMAAVSRSDLLKSAGLTSSAEFH